MKHVVKVIDPVDLSYEPHYRASEVPRELRELAEGFERWKTPKMWTALSTGTQQIIIAKLKECARALEDADQWKEWSEGE